MFSLSLPGYLFSLLPYINKSCHITALLDCDWLGYVHVFQFLEGRARVVLARGGVGRVG